MPDYLTTSEVAALLRAPVETVRYWRHVNRGPASFKAGRRVLYAEADVREWIDRQREATKAGHPAA